MSPRQYQAVVTGGASGIGRAVVDRLRADGWEIWVIDRDAEALAIMDKGIRTIMADITELHTLRDAASELEGTGVDLLVVNAGVVMSDAVREPDPAVWHETIQVNLTGTYNTLVAFEPLIGMGEGRGSVVLVSSVLAMRGSGSMASYSASKAGIAGLVRSYAQECASSGVTVNGVAPGPIVTPALNGIGNAAAEDLASLVPMKRLGTPEDVAGLVAFLASDDASFLTGQVLTLDGGLSSRAFWRP